jgi:dTDP-4-amino-4,6-dideoxygalactose transaminase
MLVSGEKELVDRARFLATQARDPAPHYEHTQIGYNYRMSNVVAAIGRGQLTAIEERVKRRREIFEWYKNNLGVLAGISFMPEPDFSRSNRWLTCIMVNPVRRTVNREKIRLALEAENIEARPLWKPMHLQPVFKDFPAYTNGVSEKLFKDGLCLPSGTAMREEDLERVGTRIVEALRG